MKNKKGQFKKSKELLDRKIFPNFFIFIILLTLGGCIGGNGSTSFKGILFGPTNNLLQSASINDSVSVNYSLSPYVLTKDLPIDPIQPSISGSIEQCSSNPTLPTGLVISGTCTITGTPTINQPATNYTITASNLSQSKSVTIVITVNANPPAALNFATPTFTFTAGAMPGFAPIVPNYTGTITNCTSDIPLPTGLSLGTTNCSLSGSPSTTQGPTNYTITASNAFGSTSTIITITVNIAPPSALNYAGSPFVFTQDATIAAIHPTYTGTVTACNSDIPLPAGLTLGTTTCVISGTPNTIQPATHYNITASNASGSISFPITITVNLAPPSALSYAGTPFTFTQGATITTATPSVTGTVTSCNSDIPLPAGLGINGTTCAISGTPTTTQSATNYTITASNAYGSTNTTISITVNPAPPTGLAYTPSALVFYKGVAGAATPTVTGTVTSCNPNVALPGGLTLNATTCAISGTPTVFQASANYTITASNSSGNTNTTISIMIFGTPPMKTMQTNCWDATGTIDATCVTASSAGQDGKLQKGTNPSFTNQTVNTTEYITIDNNTGLVWKTCHEGRSGATCTTGSDNLFNLATAITACNNLNAGTGYANRTNWRVPIISELETLANFDATANPRTFTAVFPGTLSNRYYWSSTPYLPTAGYTLVLNFGDAGTNATQTNIAGTYLRCVSP
ncbi:PF07603 family protein [Leptospira interrogans str. 2003000735]|uniref:putative Ig domain-containing protein n=1 Tax=Leptospira interrogans TaxID=173 RepID=UPI000297BAEB|nr:putative Ig domain-containing protein [Leptospira interrogans]EKQ36575.1 PF07603 family protein [Leptospira interrogans str. 2002000621]EKQ46433.1 PF07603 family protein [Leptospira interrogans str. 2002000623]EMJ74361.1 PF07603 family protein [Leptospira interrogans str. 2003000735]EMJ76648.1 PF07603 family protein [Leptospira interrogans str. 2002000631]